MMLATVAAIAVIAAIVALIRYGQDYTRRVEQHWPAQGRFVQSDGVRIHVLEAGAQDAPRVLLIHGASSNLRELWHPLADALTARWRVIAYDRPGYGFSGRAKRGAEKLKAQANVAANALAASGEGPAIIVAHSLGAAVALRLAREQPKLVAGLVLIGPASHPYRGENAWWARLASTPVLGDLFCRALIPLLGPSAGRAGVANNFRPSAVPAGYYEDAGVGLIFRPGAFQASARDVCATKAEFAAQAPTYPDILSPVIIVTGDVDYVVSMRLHSRGLARDLPNCELVIAPHTGHMPHRLRTDLVLAAIERIGAMATADAAG